MTRHNLRAMFVSLLMVLSVVAVGATPAAAQADGEINVVLEPTEQEVQPGDNATYDIVVEGNTDSISVYDATIEIADTGVGVITNFDNAFDGGVGSVDIADDGSSVYFERALLGEEITDSTVTLGTVTITAGDTEGSTTLSVADAAIGDYTNNELGSADLTVTEGVDDGGDVNVSLEPTEQEVQPGDQATYDVVVEGNDANIESYDATIEIADTGVGEITNFDDAFDSGFGSVDVADDGSSVFFQRALGNQEITDSTVTLGTVTVTAGDTEGSTTLSVADATVGDQTINELGSAELTVVEPQEPEFGKVGDAEEPAKDLDGDNFPEDVNGDGRFGVGDVQHLFEFLLNQA